MMASVLSHTKPPSPVTSTGSRVWDRVWREAPAPGKDDTLLQREQSSRRWALIAERLEAAFGSLAGLETIELGSGRGDLSVLLARRGARVTLFDASDKALDQARKRFARLGLQARYESGDFLRPSSSWAGRYDVALSSGVIEHFKGGKRTEAVRAHYEALKPGGMAIISVPHAKCWPYRFWKYYLERRRWWPYGMEIPYSKKELMRRAGAVGFSDRQTFCLSFLQSLGVHCWQPWSGHRPGWADHSSRLDAEMGLILLMFGRRAGDSTSA